MLSKADLAGGCINFRCKCNRYDGLGSIFLVETPIPKPMDIVREFRAFTISYDSKDNDDNFKNGEAFGIPEWVAYEIKKYDGDCIPTKKRPKWFAEEDLIEIGIAPKDSSYVYSRAWRKNHPDWYIRGHLCMKLIAERLGNDAGHNTHTFLNAVPQRNRFNGGIWLDLEYLTAAWAQKYGSVWVITGPIVIDEMPSGYIGETEKNEMPVAIPDALFKIVVKNSDNEGVPDVLAFIYPQIGPGYTLKPYRHERYLTSVDEIETLTGLDFLTSLSDDIESCIEKQIAEKLWSVESDDFIKACRD
ncbi:putative DNA/RNA non-specific endonuclease [Desulfosarcina variabilis str. Montpellier]